MNSTLRPFRRRRYKCDCCLYKKETRRFVSSCVNHNFKAEDVQSLCTYLKVPIEKPGEWTLLSPNQTYMRPSVSWALDKLGIIEDFCQRPHRLKEILIEVLQREDLAKTHQELLDKFHTVKKCLQHFQSTDNSPVSLNEPERIPIQESATPDTDHQDKEQYGDRQQVERVRPIAETSTPRHDISADLEADRELAAQTIDHGQYHLLETVLPQSQVERVRRDSEWSTHSRRVSSGFHERTSISSGTSGSRTTSGASTLSYRTDSGISVASSRKNTDDSLASATATLTLSLPLQISSVESIRDGFCNSCRDWIDNLSSSESRTCSPSPPVPVHNKSRLSSSYSSSDDGSSGLESSIPTTSRVEKVVSISGKMNVKSKKLIKNLKSSKTTWLHKSSLFPDAENLQGSHGQHKMRLHAHGHNSSAATAATLSLDLHPLSHGSPVQFSQLTVMVSVYATNDTELATTGHNIANSKVTVEQASIREDTEIAQFPELIPLDLLKRIEEKYIVTEVSILYM